MKSYIKHGNTYKLDKDTKFYAIWAQAPNKITFYANGGEGSMVEMNVLPGNSTNLSKNTFTKYGYSFKEWNTNPDGTGTVYKDEVPINSLTQDLSLYAMWQEIIYANVTVTGNKFTNGTTIGISGEAIVNKIRKIDLKVGNTILYTKTLNGNSGNYNESNIGLDKLQANRTKKLRLL